MDIERLKELKQQVFDSFQLYEVKMQNNFDESMKTATPTGEMDDDGKDLTALIDEAIARQSVKSEDVQKAIKTVEGIAICSSFKDQREDAKLAITALQAYEPTTRKDRIVEEAAISKTETTSCEWCEKIGKYAGFAYATFFEQTAPDEQYEISVECSYCPACGRKLN